MNKFGIAVGATVGAVFAWGAALGIGDGTLFGLSQDALMGFAGPIGSAIGALLGNKVPD